MPALQAQRPAFERMNLLDRVVTLKIERIGLILPTLLPVACRAAHDGFDVLQLNKYPRPACKRAPIPPLTCSNAQP